MTFIGVHLAGCAVLVVAGIAKTLGPDDLSVALRQNHRLSAPTARAAVRALALVEVALGGWAAVDASAVPASLVGAIYVALTAYAAWLRAGDRAMSSCGCFGTPDTPVTRAHLAVTGAFGAAALAVAVSDGPIDRSAALVSASALLAALAILTLTRYASLEAARRTIRAAT